MRRPFFFVALAAIVLALGLELGASLLVGGVSVSAREVEGIESQVAGMLNSPGVELSDEERRRALESLKTSSNASEKPPGLAISTLALVDGLLVFQVVLITLSLGIAERVHVKYQGLATLVVSLIVLILAIAAVAAVIATLTIMVGLFMATPFGTIAYLAKWGFFDRGGAAAALSVIMTFKMVFVGCLVAAHPRFLQNKSLVLLILTSLLMNVVVAFLHGLVPVFLVSITDAIAAILVGIVAALWATVALIFSLVAVIKLLL
jgi:hypothetical protein